MNNAETSFATVSLFNIVNNQHCPECGSSMNEGIKCQVGTITYMWLECVKTDCDGHRMQ
jgi:hypothetical protein